MMFARLNMDPEPKPVTYPASMFHDKIFPERQDFSLVLGGPLFQLLRRTHLAGDAMELLRQRILLISLVAWLPLLVLSLAEGQALGGRVAVPFLLDVEVHIRFLIALSLLIVAELVVHQLMRFVVRQFLERNLISQALCHGSSDAARRAAEKFVRDIVLA
jgi:hypothetical protein